MLDCKNCGGALEVTDLYCRHCGQKADAHILTLKELITNFWGTIFNLDNTFFKTIKYIWAPWKLTTWYVEGKKQSMYNPMRLFLVTLLFHFGYLVAITNIDNNKTKSQDEYYQLERSMMYKKYLGLKSEFSKNQNISPFSDSIESRLFHNVHTPEQDTFIPITLLGHSYPITRQEAIDVPIDSIYRKYQIHSFSEKLFVKQLIKMNLDRAGTIKYAIGNAAWGVLAAVFMLAVLFKLLYMKQKRYYVEHLIFWMNVHSFSFLMVTFLIYCIRVFETSDKNAVEQGGAYIFLMIAIWLFVSMYQYYKQGLLKTLIKYVVTSFFYLIIGILVVLVVSLTSLIFF